MRTIAGALLNCGRFDLPLAQALLAWRYGRIEPGSIPVGLGFLAAFVLGLFGLMLSLAGLATDSLGPQAESRPMPRWLWITLLVCFAGSFWPSLP